MTLRHLLTAFSLLHHFGELINGSPLQISAALTAITMAQKQQRPVITGHCAIVGSTAVAPTTKNVWLLATR